MPQIEDYPDAESSSPLTREVAEALTPEVEQVIEYARPTEE